MPGLDIRSEANLAIVIDIGGIGFYIDSVAEPESYRTLGERN